MVGLSGVAKSAHEEITTGNSVPFSDYVLPPIKTGSVIISLFGIVAFPWTLTTQLNSAITFLGAISKMLLGGLPATGPAIGGAIAIPVGIVQATLSALGLILFAKGVSGSGNNRKKTEPKYKTDNEAKKSSGRTWI